MLLKMNSLFQIFHKINYKNNNSLVIRINNLINRTKTKLQKLIVNFPIITLHNVIK